jgi:hypothetical protein
VAEDAALRRGNGAVTPPHRDWHLKTRFWRGVRGGTLRRIPIPHLLTYTLRPRLSLQNRGDYGVLLALDERVPGGGALDASGHSAPSG